MPRHIQVFISSPGDVRPERDLADSVLSELERTPAWGGKFTFEIFRWDDPNAATPMDARLTPQQSVDLKKKPSECDIVIVILWSRLGTPLGQKKPDGSPYLSGTEWEFDDAMERGKGPVFVFRRTDEPLVSLADAKKAVENIEQYGRVKQFFETFMGPGDSIRRSSHEYRTVDGFKPIFEQCIEGLLRRLADEADPGSGNGGAGKVPPELLLSVCTKLETVGGYKDIHDQLHELENQCYDCLVRNIDRLEHEAQRWDEILLHVDTLLEIASRIRDYALKLQQYPQGRITAVQTCFELWQAAATGRDVVKLQECKKKMEQLLAVQPGYVVTQLNSAARILLPEMFRLNELRKATAVQHDQQLDTHVAVHDTWQRLRDLLNSPTVDTMEADAWWPEVEALSDSILAQTTDGRDKGFRAALERLKTAMVNPTPESVREGLMRLRHQTKLAFHRADTDLKNLLNDLRRDVDGPCGALRTP